MNKQELIKNIELKTYTYPDEPPKFGFGPTIAYKKGFNSCAEWAINFIEQLDEPEKPIVKQFVADWFEDNKNDLEFAIWKLTIDSNSNYTKDKHKMRHWIQHAPNKPYKTLIKMLDGYEVEKEPLYEVVFLEGFCNRYLLMELSEKSYEVVPESENDGYRTQWFTEAEIKEIDERFWQFAVPVEVDES